MALPEILPNLACVVNLGAGTVSVISTASNTVIATINPVGFENLRGRDHAGQAYVPDAATDTVQVIDTGSSTRHGDDHGPGNRTLRAHGLAGGQ
jgi:YVTN family beta-propeller protein